MNKTREQLLEEYKRNKKNVLKPKNTNISSKNKKNIITKPKLTTLNTPMNDTLSKSNTDSKSIADRKSNTMRENTKNITMRESSESTERVDYVNKNINLNLELESIKNELNYLKNINNNEEILKIIKKLENEKISFDYINTTIKNHILTLNTVDQDTALVDGSVVEDGVVNAVDGAVQDTAVVNSVDAAVNTVDQDTAAVNAEVEELRKELKDCYSVIDYYQEYETKQQIIELQNNEEFSILQSKIQSLINENNAKNTTIDELELDLKLAKEENQQLNKKIKLLLLSGELMYMREQELIQKHNIEKQQFNTEKKELTSVIEQGRVLEQRLMDAISKIQK